MRALLLTLLLSSCAARQPLKPEAVYLRGPGWAATEDSPGKWFIVADDANATDAALKKICAGKFICIGPTWIGEMSTLERIGK